MASFTDIIPQFNPYIQQLPVEAMVQVGMEKQKRYDEGVQKIQTYIDNLAGIDISKPLHKQYLQSKLNELGNNLKTVAAGDFSNFQLVNSVGGMVTQIVKDPVIQNAVSSTQLVKAQQDLQAQAKAKGKSSPQNDEDFLGQVNDWFNDGDLTSKFNGEFVLYRNIDEKLRKVAEKLKKETKSADIPWKTDEDGNVLFFKKDSSGKVISASTDPNSGGEKELDITMKRIKQSGVTAQRILNNFLSSLDEGDKRQLTIDAKYAYKGITKDGLKSNLRETVSQQQQFAYDEAVKISNEIQNNTNLTSEQKAALEVALDDYIDKLDGGFFEQMYTNGTKEIDQIQDLNNYKYKIYTEKTLTNLANDLAYMDRSEEIRNNPIWRALFDQQKFRFQVQKTEAQLALQRERNSIAARSQLLREEQWAHKLEQEKAEEELDEPIVKDVPLNSNDPSIQLSTDEFSTQVRTDYLTAKASLNEDYASKLYPGKRKLIANDGLDQLYLDYLANPGNITNSDQLAYINRRREIEAKYDADESVIAGAENFANETIAEARRKGNITNATSFEEIERARINAQKEYISKYLAIEKAGKVGGLNPKGKATAKALKQIIAIKGEEYAKVGKKGSVKYSDGDAAEVVANLEKSIPVLIKNGDGSGTLKISVSSGTGNKKSTKKLEIPLNQQEMFMYFRSFAQTNVFSGIKDEIIQSKGRTTNSLGERNPGGARFFGFNVPGLSGTKYMNTTRLDIEGSPQNTGGDFDRFKYVMYYYDKGTWKKDDLTDYVYQDVLSSILNKIGPQTVEEFNRKTK